jgi:hypothetical protein
MHATQHAACTSIMAVLIFSILAWQKMGSDVSFRLLSLIGALYLLLTTSVEHHPEDL